MQYEIAEGIIFDTEKEVQTPEYYQWYNANIYAKMTCIEGEDGKVMGEKDEYNRPYKWVIPCGEYVCVITREYIDEGEIKTWRKRKDHVEWRKEGE